MENHYSFCNEEQDYLYLAKQLVQKNNEVHKAFNSTMWQLFFMGKSLIVDVLFLLVVISIFGSSNFKINQDQYQLGAIVSVLIMVVYYFHKFSSNKIILLKDILDLRAPYRHEATYYFISEGNLVVEQKNICYFDNFDSLELISENQFVKIVNGENFTFSIPKKDDGLSLIEELKNKGVVLY